MNFSAIAKPLCGAMLGVVALSSPAFAFPGDDETIENYAGVGIRGGLNDSAALVLDSKLQIFQFDQGGSVSLRPSILIGDDFEGRLPVSFDLSFGEQFLAFGGGGFAYNFDDSDFDPMLNGGIDMALSERLVLNVEGNLIFKSNDTDAEVAASINWQF